jgi:hypothetical protein
MKILDEIIRNSLRKQVYREKLKNSAKLKKSRLYNCTKCTETCIFELADKNNRHFSVGLITILQCLQFAEEHGELPKLPQKWWITVINRYNIR